MCLSRTSIKAATMPRRNETLSFIYSFVNKKIKGRHDGDGGNHEDVPQMKRLNIKNKGGWKHHGLFTILSRIYFFSILQNQRHRINDLSSSFCFISMIKQMLKMYDSPLGGKLKNGEIVDFIEWLPFCRHTSKPQTIKWEKHLY